MAASSSSASIDFLLENLKIQLRAGIWSNKLSEHYYAVFCEGRIAYIGTNQWAAIQKLDLKQPTSFLSVIRDLDHLIELFEGQKKDRKAVCQPTGKEMQAVGADFIDLGKISEPTTQDACQGLILCGFSDETEASTLEQGGSDASSSNESHEGRETPQC